MITEFFRTVIQDIRNSLATIANDEYVSDTDKERVKDELVTYVTDFVVITIALIYCIVFGILLLLELLSPNRLLLLSIILTTTVSLVAYKLLKSDTFIKWLDKKINKE